MRSSVSALKRNVLCGLRWKRTVLISRRRPAVGVDDRADDGAHGGGVLRHDAHVAAHDLHAAERAAERPILSEHEALRPHADEHLALRRAGRVEHGVLADEHTAAGHAAMEHVDRRRAQELGDKEVIRVVVHVLRLADLLHDAQLHHHDEIGDAHSLVLVVRDEHGGDARLALDAADLLARLQAQPRVQVGERLVEQ